MRFFPLFLIHLFSVGIVAQEVLPGASDTITIPGATLQYIMTYLPAGELPLDSTGNKLKMDPFWIGRFEVSQQEYALFQHRDRDSDASDWKEGEFSADAVTRPSPPYTDITFGMGSDNGVPAVSMTQQAALFYCYWLYTKTGEFYRLPTEAEWTYACLAGAMGSLPEGVTAAEIGDYAWYYDNSGERYHPDGEKKPNAWGLHDMLGNVAEWTLDQYAAPYAPPEEGNHWIPPTKRYGRTVMGGSYDDYADACHCRSRRLSSIQWQKRDPQVPKSLWWNTDSPYVGFRLVKPAQSLSNEEIEAFFESAIKW